MTENPEDPRDKNGDKEVKKGPKDTGEEYQENLEELFGVTDASCVDLLS